jgi:Holliday junction resolvase RusA-like endonuclease
MPNFEFLVPKRPVSHQTKSRANLQAWKAYVRSEALKCWPGGDPIDAGDLRFTIVYLCDESPADIDNIIKPIQDALVGLVFSDDSLVSDVDSHRRFLADGVAVTGLPELLQTGVFAGAECVYVRVTLSAPLEEYL